MGKYVNAFLEMLQSLQSNQYGLLSATINILSEIYTSKERKPISFMMKQMKDERTHPNVFLASFSFLNKAINSRVLHPQLLNASVTDYVVKKFYDNTPSMDEEVRFQFLFLVNNLMAVQGVKIDFSKFGKQIREFG